MSETSEVSEVDFRKAVNRAGMQVCGGNLPDAPWSAVAKGQSITNVAWAGRDMGLFVIACADSNVVELETLARKDLVVCSVVLDQNEARTDFAVGGSHFDATGADATMVFVPQHRH